MTLQFTPDDEDLISCSQLGDSKFYGISYGIAELWHLGGTFLSNIIAFEFMNQLHEISLHFDEDTIQELMNYFYKYYKNTEIANYPTSVGGKAPPLPKFIHLSADAETLAKFFEALGFHKV